MYILDREKVSFIKDISSDGNFFRKERVKGIYYIHFYIKDVVSNRVVSRLKNDETFLNTKIEQYLIETEKSWYVTDVECAFKGKIRLVKNIIDIVYLNVDEPYIKLFIREKSELDLIEKDSYIFRFYNSRYKNKAFKPVTMDIYTLN